MKLLLVLVALVGFACCDENDDLEKCKVFLECCRMAMDGGIPSIPVPNHNPLVIRNGSTYGTVLVTDYQINVTNNVLYNLVDFNVTYLNATSYTNPGRVAFDYNVYWPQLNFTGNYEAHISNMLFDKHFSGSYNIVIREMNWSGILNLTKPGQAVPEHLDDLILNSTSEDVEVTLTGLPDGEVALLGQQTLRLVTLSFFNNFPPTVAAFFKEKRFNDFWFADPKKIDQVMAFCNI